ncbi:MAG TPA: ABC transporter permease [Myxococcota bacterium]|nr:ABC transporter permease [Myxococcota bacterium]HQK49754.1 ABC transporter permease [Myxococcota bacterium]
MTSPVMISPRARRWRRIRALARKEVAHLLRDPVTFFLALGLPLVLLVIFGYGVSFDLDRSPLAVVDQDRSPLSRRLIQGLTATEELIVARQEEDPEAVETLFRRNEVASALVIPPGTAAHLAGGRRTEIQWVIDGSDNTRAMGILATGLPMLQQDLRREAGGAAPSVEARVQLLYNPGLRSSRFFIPGLTAYILAVAGMLLTALTIAREFERGNLEQLFATPVGPFEVIVGKLLPYLALGIVQALLVLAAGGVLFGVPFAGSLWLLALGTLLFLGATLAQGLLISVVAKSQQVATQVGALTSLLPAVLLSGFLFPVHRMPWPLQVLASIFPARYFVSVLRGVLLKGAGLEVLWPHLAALATFVVIVLSLAVRRFPRRIA